MRFSKEGIKQLPDYLQYLKLILSYNNLGENPDNEIISIWYEWTTR